ncbi:hypothetical protein O181_117119 [Austropuccinia psidii MF-1]|uniref:Uncharacterized protein n=1 Tax=Austropuccinia psidii MF-1 TaxID=1389203 RepID=A0A9Q3KCP9_9BASI|nr:hypothetical protein [Austropuccinia psidii MF-1]
MSHTLTYHSIQNVQLCHHHVGRGIRPYAHIYTPAPTREQAHAPAPTHAHANAPPHAHTNATELHPRYHPQNDNPAEANSFHG